ncbi:hypothetical protein N7481_012024 [Penicillium waksmanii]|uniref:uncharacterized protein n=1 Tax=Penicillium waksmanii TaxID=69791 RepID=UPI00254790EA|nr:uncharacterized protein N7481_012024 [Penicillium waksmanii]KAJ5965310.1 hypothetical protein N7481_012024 [Penicillium waksmanii]
MVETGDLKTRRRRKRKSNPLLYLGPPYATHRTTSSSELSSRRPSGLGYGGEESRASLAAATPTGGDQKNLPFVRPADNYRRASDEPPALQGPAGFGAQSEPLKSVEPTPLGAHTPNITQNAPVGLPEVKRFSGFGSDFFTGTDSNQQNLSSDQNSLRHNPSQASETSQGFRSVVHQAFDVPETPNSTTDSVARSNSDGTSVISPIMSHRVPTDDKTPTIPEEPADASTPTGAPQEAAEAPFFKPGHRRDISLPERDNSPSKRPIVTDHDTPLAGRAEVTSVSPGQENRSPERSVDTTAAPTIPPPNAPDGDFVAPLKFGSAGTSGSEGYRGSIPAIVGANTSPNEADNDRLREEIMRSLSRENSQEPEEQPRPSRPEATKDDSIPHQYEKYWDGQTGPGDESQKELVSESHPDWASSQPLAARDPYSLPSQEPQPVSAEAKKPKLGRRFSWESASSGGPPPVNYDSPDGLAPQAPDPIPDHEELNLSSQGVTDGDVSGAESQKAEKPRLSIVPPVSQNPTPPEQVIPPLEGSQLDLSLPDYTGSSKIDETRLQGFRDILQISTPAARVRAFEETRTQFATLDTGLNHWLQVTLHDQPQHANLIQESQTLSSGFPKASPTTRRFPKLTSLGNLSATPREDGTPTNTSHIRRPSGHIGTIVNRQNVEQHGKEFLHTAGKFGGKAGEAAKGLFAKGRSKFRQGGNDKGQSPSARKSLQFQFSFQSESANSTGYSGKTPRRSSLNFNSLPVFKFGRSDGSAPDARDPASIENSQDEREREREGKRIKSRGSLDLFGLSKKGNESNEAKPETSQYMNDFEKEMNAALGLSPTETRAQQSKQQAIAEPTESSQFVRRIQSTRPTESAVEAFEASRESDSLQLSSREEPMISADATDATNTADANTYLTSLPLRDIPDPEKDLSIPPAERTDDSASSEVADPPGPESIDLPPVPPKNLTPESGLIEDRYHQKPQESLVPPQPSHTPRQPSVSTLGDENQSGAHSSSEDDSTPPSPIQAAATEDFIDRTPPEDPIYGKPIPPTNLSQTSLPPGESVLPGFAPYPPRPPSPQEVLESKRRSISGLPPSTPGVQSPLRNEVRYSPGTRSSMLSFGSFGRQSTSNSKGGTRPNTPGNDLSQQDSSGSAAQNGDSKMDKLKSFGRRRRASVGNLLTGIQGELQGGIQGNQEKSQKKRGFSRISGFFGRQQETQQPPTQPEERRKTMQDPLDIKDLPTPPFNWDSHRNSAEPNGHSLANRHSMDKALPVLPAHEDGRGTARSSLDRPRASISGPPTTSSNPMSGNRFYSQLMSGETQNTPQHTRSQSQPFMISHPLSPVAPSISENSSSPPSASLDELEEKSPELESSPPVPPKSPVSELDRTEEDANAQQIDTPAQAPEHEQKQTSASNLAPSLSVRSRESTGSDFESTTFIGKNNEPQNIFVSGTSTTFSHPTREREARTLNETAEPVELALTRDDSSEEIIMSPTAYPGQEWTPMHY